MKEPVQVAEEACTKNVREGATIPFELKIGLSFLSVRDQQDVNWKRIFSDR